MQNYHSEWLNKGIERLASFYRKNLDNEQKAEFLDAITEKCENHDIYREAITSIIESNKYFPTIREIKNAYRAIMTNKYSNGSLGFQRLTDCAVCGGYGVVSVLAENHEYAYACKCKAGDNQNLIKHTTQELTYDTNIQLNDKETEIYNRLVKISNKLPITKEVELCPF